MKISLTKTELGILVQRSLVHMTAFLPDAPEFRDIVLSDNGVVLYFNEDAPPPQAEDSGKDKITLPASLGESQEEEAPKPARKPRQIRKATVEAVSEPETTPEPEGEEAPATEEDDIPFALTPEEETAPEVEDAEVIPPEENGNTVSAPSPNLKALIEESKKAEATQEKPEDFLPPGAPAADDAPVKPATPKGGLFAHLKR